MLLCYAMLPYAMSCEVMMRHAVLCYVMLWHALTHYRTICYVMICCGMSCATRLFYVTYVGVWYDALSYVRAMLWDVMLHIPYVRTYDRRDWGCWPTTASTCVYVAKFAITIPLQRNSIFINANHCRILWPIDPPSFTLEHSNGDCKPQAAIQYQSTWFIVSRRPLHFPNEIVLWICQPARAIRKA